MSESSELSETATSVTVSLRTPGELIASLPALLGFVPQRSLVAIAMLRHGGRHRVGGICRVDLPETLEQAGDLAEAVVAALSRSGATRVQVIVIGDLAGGAPDPVAPPHAGLVEIVSASFTAAGVQAPSPLWAGWIEPGGLWRCYESCRCEGVLPDPRATTTAAHTALDGRITYRSRDEAVAALAAYPAADSPGRRELLDAAYREAGAARVADPTQAALADLDATRDAAARIGRGETLPEALFARVVVALGDPAVRDVALGFAAGRDPAVDPHAAEALWRQLTRAVPAPEVAEPATLLAFAALRDGGGITLSVSLERATAADPAHTLSRLLGHALAAGIGPEDIEAMVFGAAAETEARFHR